MFVQPQLHQKAKLLLLTPPFTQLNTPYPATAYLKGFLDQIDEVEAQQKDWGIDLILALFSQNGLQRLFHEVIENNIDCNDNSFRILQLKNDYIDTIDTAISFLQNEDSTLAYNICAGDFLPQASRFDKLEETDWAFGNMGIRDKARQYVSLYLEDISDFIIDTIDPHFGFSRYAESLALAVSSFDQLEEQLQNPNGLLDDMMCEVLEEYLQEHQPELLILSAPFPGNMYAALKAGQYIKAHHPHIKAVLGGGYPNTELRQLKDKRVFDYIDFVTLDDGEAPLYCLIEHLFGQRPKEALKRTFYLGGERVLYANQSQLKDFRQAEVGTPSYEGLDLKKYLSVIEMVNPMHRLWNDGCWNKLTMAHGCYWGKCTFCDISLDYIERYEPNTAAMLCDRMESMIAATQQTGFHFVDEAAPPSLMKALALEIIKRKLKVTWWANIRFEKNFTRDLCKLLKASGCIAVSGGLEVASDRLLQLIKKGTSVAQVSKVAQNLTEAGIMVHAYLMYGFPTQTDQETVDSLEVVRQLFYHQVIQSGFWHQFSMTAHSPIGLDPESFHVSKIDNSTYEFANNDIPHHDPKGAQHELYSEGLRTSLFNYMNDNAFDLVLQSWFEHRIPRTQIPPHYIQNILEQKEKIPQSPHKKVILLADFPIVYSFEKKKKGKLKEFYHFDFYIKTKEVGFDLEANTAQWWLDQIESILDNGHISWGALSKSYADAFDADIIHFWNSPPIQKMREDILLLV